MVNTPTIQDAIEFAYRGGTSTTICPAHEDSSPSLSVSPGRDQPIIMKCHANCTNDAVLLAAGLTVDDISKPRGTDDPTEDLWTPAGEASAIYPYRSVTGQLLYEVLRVNYPNGGKTFRQRRPDLNAPRGHVWKLDDVERVLYRLPEITAAVRDGETIWIAEGEKDVHALLDHGVQATTNSGGAGKWEDSFSKVLAGASVVIVADADAVGRAHARAVRDSLTAEGCTVRIVEAAVGKDAYDHLQKAQLDQFRETTPESERNRTSYGFDILDIIIRPHTDVEFVIPNTLARAERLVLTGFEGHGKSTLLRQLAVQTAAGIHPFRLTNYEPKKVLVIDSENYPQQVMSSWRDLVKLAERHDRPVDRGLLTVLEEWDNESLDLSREEGAAWLQERVYAYQPDMVIMGPLANMVGRDLKDEEPVRKLFDAITAARAICGSAFVVEHHAPHRAPTDKVRQIRPYGSRLFLSKPDFGYGLLPHPNGEDGKYLWSPFRKPRVRTRGWPEGLRQGVPNTLEWPWMEDMPDVV